MFGGPVGVRRPDHEGLGGRWRRQVERRLRTLVALFPRLARLTSFAWLARFARFTRLTSFARLSLLMRLGQGFDARRVFARSAWRFVPRLAAIAVAFRRTTR
jgi:hypothetical protein